MADYEALPPRPPRAKRRRRRDAERPCGSGYEDKGQSVQYPEEQHESPSSPIGSVKEGEEEKCEERSPAYRSNAVPGHKFECAINSVMRAYKYG